MSFLKSLTTACALVFPVAVAVADSADLKSTEVDLQLVLAADRSGSMSGRLLLAQRRGFAAAFRSRELRNAILSGPLGRVAVVYFEWSDPLDQEVIVPWAILADVEDIERFANDLDRAAAPEQGGETSISGALRFAHGLFASNGYVSHRIVVDLSSNGRNSGGGPPLADALGMLRDMDATVNGLVLPEGYHDDPGPYAMLTAGYDGPLEDYFIRQVIGGPGAFAIEVDPDAGFTAAILRKLVMEVAWVGPEEDGG